MRTRPLSERAPRQAGQSADERPYLLERVGEAAIVQLYADGFASLSLREKVLVWHLYQAAIAGRDIYYDQRYARNLEMRDILEAIVRVAPAISDETVRKAIVRYTKLFWINTGPFNNLTARKFVLEIPAEAFARAMQDAEAAGAAIPRRTGETLDDLVARLGPVFFDRSFEPIVTSKTPGGGRDILQASVNNLYDGVTMADLEGFGERYALNSRLVRRDGELAEEVYRVGGRYSAALARVCEHLEGAIPFASGPMAQALEALVRFYRTGENDARREYDIAWLADRDSTVDTINGFIEVYMDARGRKGAWEALVYYVHPVKTAAIQAIAEHAQWFEDRMPWDPRYRKPRVTGVTARAIEVVVETGDAGPVTPVGINLPNDQEIREQYGSKSVTLSNVTEAYDKSTPLSFRTEFAWDEAEVDRALRWGAFVSELTTNLHEVIGHGSGLVSDGLGGMPEAALREQFSTIEEARADLVALYFVADPFLVEIGLIEGEHHAEIVLAEYEAYARNALVQLRRVREGEQLEEDHMRNRQLIVYWLMAQTDAIQVSSRDGKTYYRVVDVAAFREGVGRLLAEVQRIKAEGDYEAARALVEGYGVHFDPAVRDEVVARVDRLNLPSYTAFVMPRLEPVRDQSGEIADVRISYPLDLTAQMLEYSELTRDTRDPSLGVRFSGPGR
jgi:dipeptidyl-peptidase-3